MPVKYRTKEYKPGGYYHIYNRGLDRREVFADNDDYKKFLEVLIGYVTVKVEEEDSRFKGDRPSVAAKKQVMNLTGMVEVAAYCLLPDHFHLVVRQAQEDGITKLMRRVNTAYVMYFNRKYGRHGPLFETVYRAVVVPEDSLLELTRYLHLHPVARTQRRFGPVVTVSATRPEDYMYSSYRQYIGLELDKWVNNNFVKLSPLEYGKLVNQPRGQREDSLKTPTFD